MSDSSLSPSSLLILLRLKWRGNSQQEPQTVSNILDEYGSHPTLGHLDMMEELDSMSATVKTLKGILKGPNNSLVLQSHPEYGTASRNQTSQSTRNNQQFTACFKHNRQGTPLIYDNLNESKSKSKKVTFSAETKNTEAKTNLRYIRLKKKTLQNSSDSDNVKAEGSLANNLTPRTEIRANNSPRNTFKITKKTSDPVKSPRCLFNINFTSKQSNHLNDFEDNQEDIFKIPHFGKSLSSETPTQSYSSLQTMLDESPIYPSTDSSETINYLSQIGSFSARYTTLRTPWNAYFHDIRDYGSLPFRDDQVMLSIKREKNLDYYAELQKKTPLILQSMPSPSDSKAKPRPISKSGTRSDTFVIKKRDFIRPVVNEHERP